MCQVCGRVGVACCCVWHEAEMRTVAWLPCVKGAGAERLRDCCSNAENPQKFTQSRSGTKPASFRNSNTPQSAVRLTAPLLERGQPLREQTAAQKKKNVLTFSLACSFRHAHACHLPLGGRQRLTRCGAAEEKCADFRFWSLNFCSCFLCGTKPKNHTNRRLPPRGSCRRRRLRESARLAFFCCFRC